MFLVQSKAARLKDRLGARIGAWFKRFGSPQVGKSFFLPPFSSPPPGCLPFLSSQSSFSLPLNPLEPLERLPLKCVGQTWALSGGLPVWNVPCPPSRIQALTRPLLFPCSTSHSTLVPCLPINPPRRRLLLHHTSGAITSFLKQTLKVLKTD